MISNEMNKTSFFRPLEMVSKLCYGLTGLLCSVYSKPRPCRLGYTHSTPSGCLKQLKTVIEHTAQEKPERLFRCIAQVVRPGLEKKIKHCRPVRPKQSFACGGQKWKQWTYAPGMTRHFLLFFLWISASLFSFDLPIVYLTWGEAPENTMVIRWITLSEDRDSLVFFKEMNTSEWHNHSGAPISFKDEEIEYTLHTVQLHKLLPDTSYVFRVGAHKKDYHFATMPRDLKEPVRFVVGGDLYHDDVETLSAMNTIAASLNPHFALLGGDIAYTAFKDVNRPELVNRWLEFLNSWQKTMKTPKGNLIPILASIGNHDIQGFYHQSPTEAFFFYHLFLLPQEKSYRTLDFANYMSLFFLDSNHSYPIKGEQSYWLAHSLKQRQNQLYKFALYHVPAFPCVRSFHNRESHAIRSHWVPLFEKYGLDIAFENHDHAYKRTHFLKGKRIDTKGVLYVGDGGWGVLNPRTPYTPEKRGYLLYSASKRNFVLAMISKESADFKAIDSNGFIFDHFKITPRRLYPPQNQDRRQ